MPPEIKRMDITEFRKLGYLQELNRKFLHPLGLALEVKIDDTGEESLGGIWDSRSDPEGIVYGLIQSDADRITRFREKAEYVEKERLRIAESRNTICGFDVEPIEPVENKEELKIESIDNKVVISIGLDRLCNDIIWSDRFDDVQITNKKEFLKNFIYALQREIEEDGTNPVHKLFEDSVEWMVEQGDEGIDIKELK